MSITLITYTDRNMTISATRCVNTAIKNGVDQAVIYTPDMVNHDFKVKNQSVWDNPRGCGLWIWKSWCCMDMALTMNENDILIWSDAGCEWVNSVHYIVDRMDEDIFLFTNTFKQVEWTKGLVMDEILPEWRDGRYDNNMQVQASLIFFRINQKTKDFIKRWLCYCQMPEMLTPANKTDKDFPTYAAHREDQSILSALQIKDGYKLHWYPSATGHHVHQHTPSDHYPHLINHHRRRNNEW